MFFGVQGSSLTMITHVDRGEPGVGLVWFSDPPMNKHIPEWEGSVQDHNDLKVLPYACTHALYIVLLHSYFFLRNLTEHVEDTISM